MKPQEHELLDRLADQAHEAVGEVIKSEPIEKLVAAMKAASAKLPENYSVSLGFELRVLDSNREAGVAMYTAGLDVPRDGEPYLGGGDAAPQRFVVDGEMAKIPDDYCPHCWREWGFKQMHPTCPSCGYELGNQVKYLIDSDQCPYCGKGTLTRKNPKCDSCGFEVPPEAVVWG